MAAPARDPKFAKFNAEGKLRVEAFFAIFDNAFNALTDAQKVEKLACYLDGEPLNFYASDVLSTANIAFADARQLFETRFGLSELPPMVAAIRRRLRRSETIKEYFDDKCRDLRRGHIPEAQISDVLTEGLPDAYRSHFYGKRFNNPSEWLRLALDIEADVNLRTPWKSSPTPSKSHCSITHCDEPSVKSNNKVHFPNAFSKKAHRKSKPPFPCKYCRRAGSIEYHWHKDCPLPRDQSGQPVDTPNQSTLLEQNNCVAEFCSKPPAELFFTIPGTINNCETNIVLDTASTLNLMSHDFAVNQRLKIHTKDTQEVKLSGSSCRTSGTVKVPVRIGRLTHHIIAHTIKDFKYCLLLGKPSLKSFKIVIDCGEGKAWVAPEPIESNHCTASVSIVNLAIKDTNPDASPKTSFLHQSLTNLPSKMIKGHRTRQRS